MMLHNHAQSVSRQPPHLQTSPAFPSDGPGPVQNTYVAIPAAPRQGAGAAVPHSRDGSVNRGRVLAASVQTNNGMSTSAAQRAASAQRAPLDTTHGRGAGQVDSGLQRRASNNYGHHRQTSVIHGLQHSRNTSFNSPSTASPLSPESIHNAGSRSAVNMRRAQPAVHEASSTYNVSMTPESGHSQTQSVDSTAGFDTSQDPITNYTRKRTGTSRNRRGHTHGSSNGNQQIEIRTPGEFALHHLFHSFVIRADHKINQSLANLDILVAPVEQICGKGADASFDQLISALGHIARLDPKPLVDSLMLWRKAKGDAASACKKQLQLARNPESNSNVPPQLPRRYTEPTQRDPTTPQAFPGSSTAPIEEPSDEYILADRRATVSVYILCRGLIEMFEQSSLMAITPELAIKLEDIVFTQLRDVEPVGVMHSSLRLANWRIYGELLGQMSRLDFHHVTNRFLNQLDSWQQEISRSTGTVGARELETRVELLLVSLRSVQIGANQTVPPYVISEFLKALANLFVDSHGPTIKQAYCQTMEKLLVQIAHEPEKFQGVARFREFSDIVNSRLVQMLSKVRHWSSALPLSTLLLSFSTIELFSAQWSPTVNSLSQRLKDKNTRTQAMRAIAQLVWTYLHRTTDQPAIQLRRVEEVIKLCISQGKKTYITTEPSMAEALVQFIRIVGFSFPDTCFRHIIFPLVNWDLFNSAKEVRIEQMEPEKMVIGIRSFLALISDLEKGVDGRPSFPVFYTNIPAPESTPMSPNPSTKSALSSDVTLTASTKPLEHISSFPVNVANLDEQTTQRYLQFCEVLGKIAILCDQTFGSSAVLNEKFAMSPQTYTPKTPLVDAFTLVRKEDNLLADQKQSFYELLHFALQALPRCFSEQVPLNTLISLLCTGSAHVQPQIASSATRSLKAIAHQGYAQAVATAFPRFIFQYDSQYSTMSDEGRLGPAHIETTLTLYLDLLQIWNEQLQQKIKGKMVEFKERAGPNTSRAVQMELTNAVSLVDEMEAYGLFFLCSQSRRVRAFAVKVLRLVLQFDEVLSKEDSARVIRILEAKSSEILDLDSNVLNTAERARLQKDKRRSGGQSTLIEISSSENTYDATLWFKGFPNLIRHVFDMCPNAVALSRVVVCDRLALMQADVEKLAAIYGSSADPRLFGRSAATPVEVLFDQWKLYLIVACVTLSSPGAQSQSQLANAVHVRKTSRQVGNMIDKLSSARALFAAVIPMLGAGPDAIRSAVVIALGAINRKLYRTLLESLQYAVVTCNDEAKARLGSHQRTPSSPQRSQMTERMRTEVTHIYKLTASFLRYPDVLEDDWILNNLVTYTRELRLLLSDAEIQNDWRFLRIRYHYCGLIEELYANVNKFSTSSRWMPFESRKSAFTLMEEWCGFAPEHAIGNRHGVGHTTNEFIQHNFNERGNANASMEKEKNNLKVAALSAMAALCAGPVSVSTETNTILQFNISRMLAWTDAIFATNNDKMHAVGQRALRLLLLHNADHSQLIEHAIQQCYGAKSPRALESSFSVVTDVLIQQPEYPIALTRVLGAVMFTLGNENRNIRMKSARLLRILDDRQQKSSNLQEFDISISDKTRAVYKLAQFEYAKRLAHAHPELAFGIVSEFSLQFRRVSTDHQRNMVAAILPWLQIVELQVDPATSGPTAVSYMLLSNMLEITVKFGSALHNEVQALWQALATGPHAGNVQMILDFIINLSLERRDQNFVEFAKQIVVYLSATPAGSKVLDFLMIQLVPKNMINEKRPTEHLIPDMSGLPYVADLTTVLPTGNKQVGLSLGQVSLIFLVDLMVPPVILKKEDVIKLAHAVLILWDHYTVAVQEQAREMLVHLVHELVTSRLDQEVLNPKQQQIEQLVEAVRGNDPKVTWSYEDHTGKDDSENNDNRVPSAMTSLTEQVVATFGLVHDNFSALWAKEALHWASICPVRHLACRSFQVFRCISVTLDSKMLADMLARLSNTIADEQTDYQTFSLEILTTLRVVIGSLEVKSLLKYPQLFWTTCACLNTIHEREFFETMGMLEKLLDRLDLGDPQVIDILLNGMPEKWDGGFDGLQVLVYKGLKSADCIDRTLNVLNKFAGLTDSELTGKNNRLLYNVLANLPHFLHDFDVENLHPIVAERAERLAKVSQRENEMSLSLCMHKVAVKGYNSARQLLSDTVDALKASYLPDNELEVLIFMVGLLTNNTGWFRVKVMNVLCELIPSLDMRNTAIVGQGPDLITPLLRLLLTEYCDQALEVMDHIMEVSCTPMDQDHLRMSIATGPARAIRKEYESTQSLYGIPMTSGWSIPMPARYSNFTRNNVHAVFYTCGDPAKTEEQQEKSTPEIEFHADEGYSDSYFPTQGRADTMRTMETATDTNMGDIVSTLDSLDDFFDDADTMTPTVTDQIRIPSYFGNLSQDHDTSMYDEQTAPILSRSLARTSSSLSFQNGLAESRPSTSHQHRNQPSLSSAAYSMQTSFSSIDEVSGPGPSMSDTYKKVTQPLSSVSNVQNRPALHARSITSPANQFPASLPTSAGIIPSVPTLSSLHMHGESQLNHEDALSDSENVPFPSLTMTTSNPTKIVSSPSVANSSQNQTPISATDTAAGFSFRRGMRRLTGNKSESVREREKARLRGLSGSQGQPSLPGQSPRVPKVPLEYLNNVQMASSGSASPMTPDT